jgi:hypothetical protein
MASCSFSRQEAIPQDVLISSGEVPRHCMVLIDADCWPTGSRPGDIGGVVDLPREECETLAGAERLILTLCETAEPYRMILDGSTGRFVARKL